MKPESQSAEIRFTIRRFHPVRDKHPYWQEFSVRVRPGMTVLEALIQIRDEYDATLSWRSSCRMGVCGVCGMVINGLPRLACSTQVLDISNKALRVEPLWNFDIVKDLVADQTPLFAKHVTVQPYLCTVLTGKLSSQAVNFCRLQKNSSPICSFPIASSVGCAWQPVLRWRRTRNTWAPWR
jgi:succinate dehydrogenase/fumarate reductase iron-sulfur protein